MNDAMAAKLHGAFVHFPIALIACSWALDAAGLLFPRWERQGGLHAAGFWTLLAGAAGTVPAVVSGLVMTKGVLLGHDALRLHHLFAWPAFALIVGLAVWRTSALRFAAQAPGARYLAVTAAAVALVLAAGYWGGEMLLSS
jgi:uncharacterized membrane protein